MTQHGDPVVNTLERSDNAEGDDFHHPGQINLHFLLVY